jgi:hypothetical protein
MSVGDPPPPEFPSSTFNAAQALTVNGWDSTAMAFKDAIASNYWLYVVQDTGATVQWGLSKEADSNACPKALIPEPTFTVIKDGSRNQDGSITYKSVAYRLVLKRDGSGNQIAYAATV